ncbi:T9SS type B sorting domain-containing protein [uncultured Psychroserpens sp.]|uniref:T9SS type B sorting domain-containing protein n=1 Tax=uncultured Psychroserpens sp. TaxID=255436 RepID=UPI0026069071|nr:choice-of-anchor L domain-containing protein [uncultured Psychroserpens sp.]
MKFCKQSLALVLSLFCSLIYAQQISVNDTFTAQQLVENNLIQGCVETSNINSPVNGSVNGFNSFAYFERSGSNFPFENGIVLTTGNSLSGGNVQNNEVLNEGEPNWGTDSDLETALGISGTLNATSIEFDFVSVSNQVQFNYILASEEYFGNFPCEYSDGFALLIRESGTNDPYTNIAVLPGTATPVNTNTIHDEIVGFCDASNAQFFEGYNLGDTNYNGRTSVMTATANITPNVQYHIKFIIADQTDNNYDSAVFIEGNSFNANINLGEDIQTCASTVTLNADTENPLATYSWFLNDNLINGEIQPTLDISQSGTYRVVAEIPLSNSICEIEDTISITLSSTQPSNPITDYELCDDASANEVETFDLSTKDTEVIASVPTSTYSISYHLTSNDAQNGTNTITNPIQNTSNPQPIFVRIEDAINGCLAFSQFDLVVNPLPIITNPTDLLVCDDVNADGFTTIDLSQKDDEITNGQSNLIVTYHNTQNDANSGSNAIPQPYVNTNAIEQLFVNIINPQTGCFVTTTLNIEVLSNPVINTNDHYIDACDTDHDGFATFDLTSITNDVLQGLTGVTVTFHETQPDAESGTNPIINDTSYDNVVFEEQIVFIRVEDDTTGCASVTPIEIHSNLLLTGTNIRDFSLCDFGNDGIQQFNLNNVAETIINLLEDVTVTFYLSESDRDNAINPIDIDIPFEPTSNPQEVFITLNSPTCEEYASFNFILNSIIEFPPIDPVSVCDTDDDGFTPIDLSTFDDQITGGQADFVVTYFETEADANSNSNPLPTIYTNISNPQTIYTTVRYTVTQCADVTSFEVTVLPAPTTTAASDIIICDDDQDGISTIDLEAKVSEIVPNTTNTSTTFHISQADVESNSNAITNTSAYVTSTQTIFVRVENALTGCFASENFEVIVNTLPVFNSIENYKICENQSDGIGDFLFSTKDTEILNGQTGKEVFYFESQVDAHNNTNAIDKTTAYQNTSNPQTIFVRVENTSDTSCYDTSSFIIEIGTNPQFNIPTNWFVCDDIANDGSELFDLNEKITEISQGFNDIEAVRFYTSQADAENNVNEISLLFNNTVNPQQLYAVIDNGTICNSVTSFELNVIQSPDVNPSVPIELCDTNYDGITVFDITDAEFDILDVRQNNITVTYFENEADLVANINAIQNPNSYTNLSNPQTVFIRVTNTISNCYLSIPLELIVNLPPTVNDFQTYEICDNSASNFNLSTIESIIVDDATDIIFSYYSTLNDAQTNTNSLGTNYTYQTTNDVVFVRLDDSITSCFAIYPFELIVNPLPIANQPPILEACDDNSNDSIESFNLFAQNNLVLGTQNATDFTITYHSSQLSATTGIDTLPNNYNGSDGETIFVRIENNTTGCFSLTQFNLLVNPYPNEPSPIDNCDTDYDGLTTFDLTQAEPELLAVSNPNNIVSYFSSIADLEANINAIQNPTSYTNTVNPQTVYIKVYNTSADCFSYVPLLLDANLPPAINQINTYEICDNTENIVDLTEINSTLLVQTANVIVSYYATLQDAENQTNILANDYNYQTNNDTLFARIEFSTTHCYYIHEFNLHVNPLPIANQPNDMISCDDDFDGLFEFNLNQQTTQILGGQDPTNFTVGYYQDITSAELNENQLTTTYSASNGELIYARIENNITACYAITQFTTIVYPRPIVNIGDQVLCIDNLPLLVSANTNEIEDTYLWSTNETTPEIEITEIGTYSVTVTSPFGCETIEIFNVTASETATIEITESIDFSDPNNITVTISGIGNYLYQLDNEDPQFSNVFQNVSLGYHTITIVDLNGCAEITKEIVVIDAPKFMTPNGDGYFDTWHITGVETLPGTIVYVYDRYGKLLKQLDSSSNGWDGTYNGQLMPATDYWFLAKVRKDNIAFEVKGHFALRR